MRRAGQTCARRDILLHVWQYDFDGLDNILDVYISHLRAKIDKGRPVPAYPHRARRGLSLWRVKVRFGE